MRFPRLSTPEGMSQREWAETCGTTAAVLLSYRYTLPPTFDELGISSGQYWAMQAWSHALDFTGEREIHQPIRIRNYSEGSQRTENLYDID